MNLKFETIAQIFGKIIQLNAVIIFKSTNEYYRKIISKCGCKMDLYPTMINVNDIACNLYQLNVNEVPLTYNETC